MNAAVIAFGCAAGWFAAFVCIQLALMRVGAAGARSLLAPFAAAVLMMFVSVVVVLHRSPQDTLLAAVLSLLTIACLFILYVPALYTLLASQSVQTMIALRREGGRLPEAQLYERFASRAVVQGRLKTLERSGYLQGEGSYNLTSRGRAIAAFFSGVKTFWVLGPGG